MASSSACITFWRFLRSSMSMKSTTMMPPRSRRRICRTISLMASVLVLTMVSSRRFDLPTYLPVFTSMATSASVWLMTMWPPDFSHTLGRSAFSSSAVMPNSSKIGVGARVQLHAADQRGLEALHEAQHAFVDLLVIHPDALERAR